MDRTLFANLLPERRIGALAESVAVIEAGIAAAVVRNADFTKAKEMINWCVSEAAEAFIKAGKHEEYDRSRWGRVYAVYAFVHTAHDVPSAVKKARKAGNLADYVDFLEGALLPLNELLQAAKPLIVKRQQGPEAPRTQAQLERESATMTCQCCGGRYLANTGSIAHHGYKRPGNGWQTASCMGAKFLPFEVSSDRLGLLIQHLTDWEKDAVSDRKAVAAETKPVTARIERERDHRGNRKYVSVDVTDDTFSEFHAKYDGWCLSYGFHTFESLKDNDLAKRDRQISGVRAEIREQISRFEGWKKTHDWTGSGWALTKIEKAA